MDFFKKAVSSATQSEEQHDGAESLPKKHSTSELFSSAKVVAGAAQDTFANQSDKIDREKVAGAAGDLLGGAKEYGKLEEDKGLGKYVGQAETYLHSYGSSGEKTVEKVGDAPLSPPAAAAVDAAVDAVVADEEKKVVVEEEKKVVEEEEKKKDGGAAAAVGGQGITSRRLKVS